MNETLVTVVGNVATAPVVREFATGRVVRFRLAATARYRDRTGGAWTDGHTNFFTVCAWRALAENAMASLSVGEPVIVRGRLKVRQEDRGDGKQWFAADIEASAIGHDLSRGTAAFHRTPFMDRTDRTDRASFTDRTAPVDRGGAAATAPAPFDQDPWAVPAPSDDARPTPGEADGTHGTHGARGTNGVRRAEGTGATGRLGDLDSGELDPVDA
ncbi:single-stranded DNA-binding protein [Streptomyces sp. JNUCC 64]